jgi:uncharacterized membrane protein YgdD (TMEM256/DUF423 family)
MVWTQFIMAGALSGALGVVLGAFGAHALKSRLSSEYLTVFETGVRYQMYHALALLCLGVLATRVDAPALKLSGYSFVVGTILFSGSLYALTLSGVKAMGIVTPFGGLALIVGWVSLFWGVYKV